MITKVKLWKEFISSAKAYFANAAKEEEEMRQRCPEENKADFYKRHGIYIRGGWF